MPDIEQLIDANSLLKELDALRERRDEAIEVLTEQLNNIGYCVTEGGSELDDKLAERDYSSVLQLIDEVTKSIETGIRAADGGDLTELAQLASIQFPNDAGSTTEELAGSAAQPSIKTIELPSPDTVDREQEVGRDDIVEVLSSRVTTCADRMRYLVHYFSEQLWPYVVGAAKDGEFETALAATAECEEISKELRDCFELWQLWLSELYNESPSHLGPMGDWVASMGSWLTEQR